MTLLCFLKAYGTDHNVTTLTKGWHVYYATCLLKFMRFWWHSEAYWSSLEAILRANWRFFKSKLNAFRRPCWLPWRCQHWCFCLGWQPTCPWLFQCALGAGHFIEDLTLLVPSFGALFRPLLVSSLLLLVFSASFGLLWPLLMPLVATSYCYL